MTTKRILVLGGGWGGLVAAHQLRMLVPSDYRISVIEKSPVFSLRPSYLWVMSGERNYPTDVERDMSRLADKGIEWIHDEVLRIDPETRTVYTGSGVLEGDYLVIALGAESIPNGLEGFAQSAYDVYDTRGVVELRRILPEFDSGKVVILITRAPFRCPSAPYEAAFLADSIFRKQGTRDRVDLAIYTPEKQPMPVAGPVVGQALRGMMEERKIQYFPERTVTKIDGASRKLFFGADEVSYDLLIGVPPHKAPRVVEEAKLTDASGYIPVHPQTLEILAELETLKTRYRGVFAIGDVTSVTLPNLMRLPKAGVFAEEEARVVAKQIAADIRDQEASARYDGKAACYVDVGDGLAAYGYGNFYGYPAPTVHLEPPSPRYRREKEQFEQMLETWFAR